MDVFLDHSGRLEFSIPLFAYMRPEDQRELALQLIRNMPNYSALPRDDLVELDRLLRMAWDGLSR